MKDFPKKPSLRLLSVSRGVNLDELVEFLECLTGRKPTPAEVEAAKKALKELDFPGHPEK